MAYSEAKKKEIEDLIREGKKAKEIAEMTGVSISTVYKMKKNMQDNSVELVDKVENDKGQEKEKNKLIWKLIGKKDYETAKELAQEIIEDEAISAETKAIVKGKLITIAIREKDYTRAKELAGEIIDDEEVSTNQKAIAKSQLIGIAIKEKDYAIGKELAQEILENAEVSSKTKAVAKSQLVTIARKEKDYTRAKKLAREMIDDEELPAETKAVAKSQLIGIATEEKDYARTKELAGQIINDEVVPKNQKTKTEKLLMKIAKKEEYTRKRLYAGKIPVDYLTDLVEKNSGTITGCLFIAEAYKYFKAEELGIKWLNGYKRKNPDMPDADKKAIAGAMDILNSKRPVVIGVLQEQWDDVYSRLQSKTALEGHSDDEDQR